MKYSRLFLSACVCAPAFADEPQCKPGCSCKVESEEAVTAVSHSSSEPVMMLEHLEHDAQFPGGDSPLRSWLARNLRYLEKAAKKGIEGRVIVQFMVETDGSITHPVVVRGVDKDLDKEAIRVVKQMPRWQPSERNGIAVRCKYTLPIFF